MNRLRVQPLARADAHEAAAWYEAERPGLGVEFVLELDRAVEKVAEAPHSYAPVSGNVRAALADLAHAEHERMLEWVGGVFDSKGFDLNRINRDWRAAG